MEMTGKICLITGSTSGIGFETAVGLAKKGAQIILSGRSPSNLQFAENQLKMRVPGVKVDTLMLDLGSQESVRKAAGEVIARFPRLDVLVNNAGAVYADLRKSPEGFELQWATNHLGPFLLTHLLLPLLQKSSPSRIINVSSTAHYSGTISWESHRWVWNKRYRGLAAYSQSKLANVLFTKELAKKINGTGVSTFSLHPGIVKTKIGNKDGNKLFAIGWSFFAGLLGISVEKGAQTSIFLASTPGLENLSGNFFDKCKVKKASAKAQDAELAEKLWKVSLDQTNLNGPVS